MEAANLTGEEKHSAVSLLKLGTKGHITGSSNEWCGSLGSEDWVRIGAREASGEDGMTTIQLTLPDQLAQDAERSGLLSPESLEEWLRKQLKAKAAEQLFVAMDRMAAVDDPSYMSPEEVAEEIKAMRAERRAKACV